MARAARDILAPVMNSTKPLLTSLVSIAYLLVSGPAPGATVKDGGFTCSTSTKADVTSVRVTHGGASLEREAPAGTWDEKGLECRSWQGKAVRVTLPSKTGGAFEIFAGLDLLEVLSVAQAI